MNGLWAWYQLAVGRAWGLLQTVTSGIVVVFLVGSTAAVLLGGQHQYQANHARFQVELQDRVALHVQTTVGPSGRAVDGRLRVLRPPEPGAVWASAYERARPSGWDFGPAGVKSLAPYPVAGRGVKTDLLPDVEAVLRLLGGGLALMVGVSLILGERTSGWTLVEATSGRPPWYFHSARLVSGVGIVGSVSVAWALLTGLVGHWWLPGYHLSFGQWLKVVSAVWVYGVVVMAVGYACGLWCNTERRAVAVAVSVWAGWVLVSPQVALLAFDEVGLSARFRFELEQRERYADAARNLDEGAAAALVERLGRDASLRRTATESERLFAPIEPSWTDGLHEIRDVLNHHEQLFAAQSEHQTVQLQWLARFNPGLWLHDALATAAQAGHTTTVEWERAVQAHATALSAALFDDRPSIHLRLPLDRGDIAWTYIRQPVKSLAELPMFDPPR